MRISKGLGVVACTWFFGFSVAPVEAQGTKAGAAKVSVRAVGDLSSAGNRATFIGDGTIPLTVKAGDMNASWQEFHFNSSLETDNENTVFYTRGQIVTIDGENYWVAYERAPLDVSKLSSWQYRAEQMAASKGQLHPETVLSLSLLHSAEVKKYARLKDIEPFDETSVSPEFNDSKESVSYFNVMSLKYLRKINEALASYKTDFEYSTMPRMKTPEEARNDLLPYAENPAIFVQPGTNRLYVPNAFLSEEKLAHLRVKTKYGSRAIFMVVFYEDDEASDGSRGVLMLDGSVRRMNEDQWARAKHLSHIDQLALTDK